MSTQESRADVSGIAYHLGDDVLWERDGRIWKGRIESTPRAHEDTTYTIMFSGTETAEVGDDDILGCAAGFWCDTCGGVMKLADSRTHDLGFVQWFNCSECDGHGKRYVEPEVNIDSRSGDIQPSNDVLEGQPVDSIPTRSKPGDDV